jgi:superfamily II RNA helicase
MNHRFALSFLTITLLGIPFALEGGADRKIANKSAGIIEGNPSTAPALLMKKNIDALVASLSPEDYEAVFGTSPAVVAAIRNELSSKYHTAIEVLSESMSKCMKVDSPKKAESNRLVKDLIRSFGEEYLRTYVEQIVTTIMAINLERNDVCTESAAAKAIFHEDRYLSYELELAQKLSEVLDKKDAKFKEKNKAALDDLIKLIDLLKKRPVEFMTKISSHQLVVQGDSKVNTPAKLSEFLRKHQDLKSNYSMVDVIEAFSPYRKP